MSVIYEVTVLYSIYGKFADIWKLDSGCMHENTYIFIKNNFLSYKTWKQN